MRLFFAALLMMAMSNAKACAQSTKEGSKKQDKKQADRDAEKTADKILAETNDLQVVPRWYEKVYAAKAEVQKQRVPLTL